MKTDLLNILCCPFCEEQLSLADAVGSAEEIKDGSLRCQGCCAEFAINNYIPRFVPRENYSASFGFQWNQFRMTQLDSHSGLPISRDRFLKSTGWTPEELRGSIVLDAGCGSGRFAEVALACGATVIAVDCSAAVDACWQNLASHNRFHVLQADIRHLPFRSSSFDYVYTLGVLQHTPDPHAAFAALPKYVRPGGSLAVDIYRLSWKCLVMPKYWLRPFSTRIPATFLFGAVKRIVPLLMPLSSVVSRVPVAGKRLRYLIPVANYEGLLPLRKEQLLEWAVLDTFDMLSPAYDKPKTVKTVQQWFEDEGLQAVRTDSSFVVMASGRKSSTSTIALR